MRTVKIIRTVEVIEEIDVSSLILDLQHGYANPIMIEQVIAVLTKLAEFNGQEYFKINMIKAAREAYSETVPGQIIGLLEAKNMIEAAIAANERAIINRRQS